MRILMISWNYPPAVGGSEKMAERLVGELSRRGHSLEVWTAPISGAPSEESPAPGIRIRRFLRGLQIGPLFGATATLQTACALFSARRRFDVVHIHAASWNALGAVAVRRAGGPPVLVMIASAGPLNDVTVMRRRKGGAALVRWLSRVDRIVALCRAAREEIAAAGIPREKAVILPNGVDLSQYPFLARPEPGAASLSHPLILFVGRLDPVKRVDVLLRAFAEARQNVAGARLRIVGDGPMRAPWLALARELGLRISDTPDPLGEIPAAGDAGAPSWEVHFAGESPDPRPHYAQAAALVLPSLTEGMSNVLVEAMALGLPVIATAVGGNPDLLDPEDRRAAAPPAERESVFQGANGLLIPPEDPEALAQALRRLLDSPDLGARLGRAARAHAERHFSLSAVADRYEALYRELNPAAAQASRKS